MNVHCGRYIDLHVHSQCSDGKQSVKEIINFCLDNNVGVISLVEHYNLGSYKQARTLAGDKIEIIPGMEFGTDLKQYGLSKNHVCHIAAYYPSGKIMRTVVDKYETSRDICVKKTLQALNKKNIFISKSDVMQNARKSNSIGRFDIAITLAKLGYAKDSLSAYGEFLDQGMPGYIERTKLNPAELITEIRLANGVPVLVHPKSLKLNGNRLFEFLEFLKSYGLEGLEVYNPHHTKNQVTSFLDMASELSLITTVGSDFHGRSDADIKIGSGINYNLCINDYSIIEELKKRHKIILNAA
ncbi:MAG: PHP domain-containing protein [Clostridia bacterium]|nr:PHP domain-containing protein [Clostridia bacterium]MDD4376001.1 PHP domain-containing protein [Clostridia bacterium]